MNSYKCELCDCVFNSKYNLMNHSRSDHNIKMTSDEITDNMIQVHGDIPPFENDISDEDLKMAIQEFEIDDVLVREFEDTPMNEETLESREAFESKLKALLERVCILAKHKAVLKRKIKLVETIRSLLVP